MMLGECASEPVPLCSLLGNLSKDMDKTKATPPTRADGARSEASSPASAAFFSATGSRPSPHPSVPSAAPFSAPRSRPHATVPSVAPFSASRPSPHPTVPSVASLSASHPRSRPAVPCATPFSATGSRRRPTAPSAATCSATRFRPIPALRSLRADVDYSKHDAKMMKKLRLVPEEEWFPHERHDRHLTGDEFWTVVQKDLYLALKKPTSYMRWIDWGMVHKSTGTDVRRYFAATPGLDRLLERRDLCCAESHIRQFYATLWIHPDRSRIKFMFGGQQRELSRDDFAKYLGLSDSGARGHSLAYQNPDAAVDIWKDHNQWNHETAVVHAVVRMSIWPRSGGPSSLAEIWILHLLMSAKPVNIVDLMIEEMQEIILNIKQRRLPYAPYLIHLFDKKGWLEHGMKNDLGQHLKLYNVPKPDDKRFKNRALQPVKSYKAPKPDSRRRVGTSSLPPPVEAGFDDDQHAHLDRTLSPSIEEHALVVTTSEEDDPHMVPALARDEFRFSQQGAHDAEAGGSGCHADVPLMLQSQADRQTSILEQIQGQLAELQRQNERNLQQIQGQLGELQGQLGELQGQRESDRQENRDLRNLVLLSLFQTAHRSTQHDDLVSLLNENLADICGHPLV